MAMADVSAKDCVFRRAVAKGTLRLSEGSAEAIRSGKVKKGDPLAVAEVAAYLAVKDTPSRIPHCHPVPVTSSDVTFEWDGDALVCTCAVGADYRTGVEMEALSGVTSALLTVWDMVKYMEKDEQGQYPDTVMEDIRVVEKVKGG